MSTLLTRNELLSYDELNTILKVVLVQYEQYVETIDVACNINPEREVPNNRLEENFISNLYFKNKIHTFFLNREIVALTEVIFMDSRIRDFILAFTDLVMVLISVSDVSYVKLRNTIVHGVCNNKQDLPATIIPEIIKEQLIIDKDELFTLIDANSWLLCIYLLLLVFPGSNTYKDLVSNQSNTGIKK